MNRSEFALAAVVSDLTRASEAIGADALEFRMDHAEDPLDQLNAYEGTLPIIATNRSETEGGTASGSKRIEDLVAAAKTPAVVAVDIELKSLETGEGTPVLEATAGEELASIVSWHDFDGTPARDELRNRLEQAARHGDVAKAAVTAKSSSEVLDLLRVTHEISQDGVPVATMSMGALGSHSRIIAPLYGSRIGYAPIEPEEATAPGQFDLATMRRLLDEFHVQ